MKTGRIRLLGAAICLFACIIIVRLYFIQIVRHDAYRDQADKQYIQKSQALFDRGAIYFSPKVGEPLSAATLATGYTVSLNPRQIEEPEDVFNTLSGIVDIDEGALLAKIDADKTYTEIARRVPENVRARIDALDLKGISTYKERWRYYPGNKTAANVLGFVGYEEDGVTLSGRYGLEKMYNDTLSRRSADLFVNFFAEIFAGLGGGLLSGESSEGSIITTIEPTVQAELEKKLRGVETVWKSDLSGGIIMDPYTGEIYAMALNPSFDPNEFAKEKNPSLFKNQLVDGVYEMGSIVKPLAMAAAIDAGVVTPSTTYDDKGSIIVNSLRISNFDGKARGITNMQKVLNESLNVGMAFVAQKLGNKKITDYFLSFGFGEETGIDLPGEAHGLVENLQSPRDVEHVTAAYGQGIALTPIATIRALSALGNGGFLPNPHIVKRIEYTNGESKELTYEHTEEVLKPETSETITRMLVKVVDEALLGGSVKQPHYTIAAKTGTAQMAREDGKGYYDDRYLHSFFGYFPAYKPRFIVFLFTLYPKGAQYASHTLTVPFIDLTKFLVNYYEVPPDR